MLIRRSGSRQVATILQYKVPANAGGGGGARATCRVQTRCIIFPVCYCLEPPLRYSSPSLNFQLLWFLEYSNSYARSVASRDACDAGRTAVIPCPELQTDNPPFKKRQRIMEPPYSEY